MNQSRVSQRDKGGSNWYNLANILYGIADIKTEKNELFSKRLLKVNRNLQFYERPLWGRYIFCTLSICFNIVAFAMISTRKKQSLRKVFKLVLARWRSQSIEKQLGKFWPIRKRHQNISLKTRLSWSWRIFKSHSCLKW